MEEKQSMFVFIENMALAIVFKICINCKAVVLLNDKKDVKEAKELKIQQ